MKLNTSLKLKRFKKKNLSSQSFRKSGKIAKRGLKSTIKNTKTNNIYNNKLNKKLNNNKLNKTLNNNKFKLNFSNATKKNSEKIEKVDANKIVDDGKTNNNITGSKTTLDLLKQRQEFKDGIKGFNNFNLSKEEEKEFNEMEVDGNHYFKEDYFTPKTGENRSNQVYMMQVPMKAMGLTLLRGIIIGAVTQWAITPKQRAQGKSFIDTSSIPEGRTATTKWRGKPIFVKHRTDKEIAEAVADDTADLRDPEKDADRVVDPKWLICIAVCTHLGCVPLKDQGDFKAFFCPCHGSHYDLSGRIRKGPAPRNLDVPPYYFKTPTKIVVGETAPKI